jgi:hypothetical protein
MKKRNRSALPWCLPNHNWLPADWIKPDSPRIIRTMSDGILVRDRPWGERRRGDPGWRLGKKAESSSNDIYCDASAMVELLFQRSENGSAEAAMELARIASEATERLTEVGMAHPELLRPLASVRHGWPVIKIKRERLSRGEENLFTKIGLGIEALIELDPTTSKWKWDDATRIAFSLIRHIDRIRKKPHSPDWDYGKLGDAIKRLRPFTDATLLDWWDAARAILLASYPEPQQVAELSALVTSPSKRKSPGRIRAAILELLKDRVRSFARNPCFDKSIAYQT